MNPQQAHWPQADGLHLVLSSLGQVIVDQTGVRALRAEDATGSFSIWPGQADFLTVLSVGVLSWRDRDDAWHHCAVRRGVLTLRRGCDLEVATREAIPGDDLDRLEHGVLAHLAERQATEDQARRQVRQLEVRALRELVRPFKSGSLPQGPWP